MRGAQDATGYLDHARLKKEIGERLRKARKERKISAKTMSSLMEVCYQCIWKYEEGITDIPITRLLQYCQRINVPSDEILVGLILNETRRSNQNGLKTLGALSTDDSIHQAEPRFNCQELEQNELVKLQGRTSPSERSNNPVRETVPFVIGTGHQHS